MKILMALLFLLNCLFGNAQDDYYMLVKNGEKYVKPVYYLSDGSFQNVEEINNILHFEIIRNRFSHNPDHHEFHKIKDQFPDSINFVKPEQLYQLEEEEFNRRTKEISEISGFKPPPPIKHRLLKIFVVRQKKESYYIYEVDWISF